MEWSDVGNAIVDYAPEVAGLLTNPVSSVVKMGTKLIKKVFGVEEPDEAMKVIKSDPQALVKLKELDTRIKEKGIDAEMNEITQAANIIQVEAKSEDPYVRRTRPMILRWSFYVSAILSIGGLILIIWLSTTNKLSKEILEVIVPQWKELCIYYGGMTTLGFLGYTRYRSINDKPLMAGKAPPKGILGVIAERITKK